MTLVRDTIPAPIVLVGIAAAILIRYRQWKLQQDSTRESEFRIQEQQTCNVGPPRRFKLKES